MMCRDLIRIDTAGGGRRPERPAAEYVAERLSSAGTSPVIIEAAPGRASVVATITGEDTGRSGVLVHGHLDTAPAGAGRWSDGPCTGEVRDGLLWGRGAIDMKSTVAVTLATVLELARTGWRPRRTLTMAFVADGTSGGRLGAGYLARRHPELIGHCSDAIGESGGFGGPVVDGWRSYPIRVGQKSGRRLGRPAWGVGDGPSTAGSSADTPFFAQLAAALRAEDPRARPVADPRPAGAGAAWFEQLGIACYGFTPLHMPAGCETGAGRRGTDERIPVNSFAFGCRVLRRLLDPGPEDSESFAPLVNGVPYAPGCLL